MTRRVWVFILLAVILFIILGFCGPKTTLGGPVIHALDGATATPTDICVRIPHDGSAPYYCDDESPVATDTPSPTPTTTHTPTATSTLTSTPTATMTNTPSPTSTPLSTWEPTQEDILTPTNTPAPTSTPTATPTVEPTAVPNECTVQNTSGDNVNVRSSVELLDDNWLGVVEPDQYIHPEGIYHGDIYDWYLIWWDVNGDDEATYAWTVSEFYTEITDCSGLIKRRTYDLGVHMTTGFQCDLAVTSLDRIQSWKGVSSTEQCLISLMNVCPGCQFTWRTLILGDGDLGWGIIPPKTLANLRYFAEKALWINYGLWSYAVNPTYDLHLEYWNEQSFIDDDYSVEFHLQMLRNATADGVCLAVFSDGYGNPEFDKFAMYAPVFEYILENPCHPNQLHAVALHTYSQAVVDGEPVYNQWLFNRWEVFWESIADQIGNQAYLVPVIFSEMGVANTKGAYDGRGTADCARAWTELDVIDREIYSRHPEVYTAHIFAAGTDPTWLDFSPCLK